MNTKQYSIIQAQNYSELFTSLFELANDGVLSAKTYYHYCSQFLQLDRGTEQKAN